MPRQTILTATMTIVGQIVRGATWGFCWSQKIRSRSKSVVTVLFLLGPSASTSAGSFDHARLCDAIGKGQLIKLYYRAGEPERIVEPRYLGYTRDRNVILNGWQTGGYSQSGNLPGSRSFRLDRTARIEFTAETASNSRGTGRLPSGIVEVICQVK
jgi:hypothetical protein